MQESCIYNGLSGGPLLGTVGEDTKRQTKENGEISNSTDLFLFVLTYDPFKM